MLDELEKSMPSFALHYQLTLHSHMEDICNTDYIAGTVLSPENIKSKGKQLSMSSEGSRGTEPYAQKVR